MDSDKFLAICRKALASYEKDAAYARDEILPDSTIALSTLSARELVKVLAQRIAQLGALAKTASEQAQFEADIAASLTHIADSLFDTKHRINASVRYSNSTE